MAAAVMVKQSSSSVEAAGGDHGNCSCGSRGWLVLHQWLERPWQPYVQAAARGVGLLDAVAAE